MEEDISSTLYTEETLLKEASWLFFFFLTEIIESSISPWIQLTPRGRKPLLIPNFMAH